MYIYIYSYYSDGWYIRSLRGGGQVLGKRVSGIEKVRFVPFVCNIS